MHQQWQEKWEGVIREMHGAMQDGFALREDSRGQKAATQRPRMRPGQLAQVIYTIKRCIGKL